MEYVSQTLTYDRAEIDNAVVDRIPFLLLNKADSLAIRYGYEGIIDYGYTCDNQLSRVNLFKYQTKKNNSSLNVISSIIYKDSDKGFLDVGHYPPNLYLYPKNYKTSKVHISIIKAQWNIYLDSLYIGYNTYYKINDFLSIGINDNVISVKKCFF